MNNTDSFLTQEQLAITFGISTYTVKALIEKGTLPYKTDTLGCLCFQVKDIATWLYQKEKGSYKDAA